MFTFIGRFFIIVTILTNMYGSFMSLLLCLLRFEGDWPYSAGGSDPALPKTGFPKLMYKILIKKIIKKYIGTQ